MVPLCAVSVSTPATHAFELLLQHQVAAGTHTGGVSRLDATVNFGQLETSGCGLVHCWRQTEASSYQAGCC